MGTALTEGQVGELARLAPVVLLCLDADSAGQEAMLRAAKVAAGRNVELRVVPLPAGKDPADLALEDGPGALRTLVESSVPFVRFSVERELGAADLDSAEGKDRAIAALRPLFAQMPPSAVREELLRLVADRTDLAPALVSSWLSEERAAPNGRSTRNASSPDRRSGAAVGAGERPAKPVRAPVSTAVRVERAFLAQCVALGTVAARTLVNADTERLLSVPLHRRAAAHLAAHLDAPAEDLPDGDDELRALIAELAIRAARTGPSPAALQAELLKLELAALDREIAAAKAAGLGGVSALTAQRVHLKPEVDRAIAEAMEEAPPT
jgi:DNA primase